MHQYNNYISTTLTFFDLNLYPILLQVASLKVKAQNYE